MLITISTTVAAVSVTVTLLLAAVLAKLQAQLVTAVLLAWLQRAGRITVFLTRLAADTAVITTRLLLIVSEENTVADIGPESTLGQLVADVPLQEMFKELLLIQ